MDPGSPDFAFGVNYSRFPGYSTNVGYVLGSGDPGALDPIGVSRGAGGGNIGFSFASTAAVILSGKSTDFLVIATNAKTYDIQGVMGIAGGHDSDPTHNITGQIFGLFEPTFVATPEPSTALLLSLGLVGIAVFHRRRTSIVK